MRVDGDWPLAEIHAMYVPGSPAAWARALQIASAPASPPRLPVYIVLVANTSRASQVHCGEQPSSMSRLPSSHSSMPCTKPSPQAALVHMLVQLSVLSRLPSSQLSTNACT